MELISFKRNEAALDYEICVMGSAGPVTYVGNCTVWHEMETGERCSTPKEIKLNAIWHRERRRLMVEKSTSETHPSMRNVTPIPRRLP